MPTHDIIVIGASAGGVEALISLVRSLPTDLPATLFVVTHVPAQGMSVLPHLLTRAGPLPAIHAQHGETIQPGYIYVARPDHHLLVQDGVIHVVRGPKENHCRPAIDPLFRSAAASYGSRVSGVILSGTLSDGTAGLLAIKRQGGVAIVQDPDDALFPDMPRHAIQYVRVDYILPVAEIASVLVRLADEPAATVPAARVSTSEEKEIALAEADMATIENEEKSGTPSVFGCPECGGTLWELQEENLLRFRCRIGHAYSSDSLLCANRSSRGSVVGSATWVGRKCSLSEANGGSCT